MIPKNWFAKQNQLNNYDFDTIHLLSQTRHIFLIKRDSKIYQAFQNHSQIVCANPLIKTTHQYNILQKDPTFLSLLIGFCPFLKVIKIFRNYDFIHKNKYKNYVKDTFKATFLSGSFLVVKANIFKKVKGFTNSYFLHLEDADFVRKCSKYGLTAHLPKGVIIHKWNRGSHKSLFQISHVIRSMIIYFIFGDLNFSNFKKVNSIFLNIYQLRLIKFKGCIQEQIYIIFIKINK